MPIRSGILRTRKAHHHRVIRADHWKSRRNKRNLRARKQHKAGSSPADFDANVASTPCQPSVIGREPKQNKKRCTFLPTYNNRLWEVTTKKRVSKCPRPKCGVKLSGMCPKATPSRIPTRSTGEKHFHDGPKNLAVIRPYIIQGQREEEKKEDQRRWPTRFVPFIEPRALTNPLPINSRSFFIMPQLPYKRAR